MPTNGQIGLLLAAVALFTLGGAFSLARALRDRPGLRAPSRWCAIAGVGCAIAVLVWHSIHRGSWVPLEDNFDALTFLAVMLALFVMYVQRVRPLAGLDWFVWPTVILLLIGAAVFGRVRPHVYTENAWSVVHRASSYGGAVAFAVAAAVGSMYLIASRRLRNRTTHPGPNMGSLERLEGLMLHSVTLGFALLTIGLVTGVVRMFREGAVAANWTLGPKIWLTVAIWLVYALVLHAPMTSGFRGRKAAMLSIVGFALMVGTVVVVQFMPRSVR